jgi:uncharacterized protein (TIGR00369 family)
LPELPVPDALAGFARWPRRSPFGDAAGPLFFRADEERLTFATRIEERHGNVGGYAHGGMLSTFADLALGYATACSTDPPTRMRTVSLTIDYIGAVSVGDTLLATPQVLRVGSRLAHATALLTVGDAPMARASATFAVVAAP